MSTAAVIAVAAPFTLSGGDGIFLLTVSTTTTATPAAPTTTAPSVTTTTTRPVTPNSTVRVPSTTTTAKPSGPCSPAYPDFCIPPPPPDLDCRHIARKRFTVRPPDPHGFDADHDGIGCET